MGLAQSEERRTHYPAAVAEVDSAHEGDRLVNDAHLLVLLGRKEDLVSAADKLGRGLLLT